MGADSGDGSVVSAASLSGQCRKSEFQTLSRPDLPIYRLSHMHVCVMTVLLGKYSFFGRTTLSRARFGAVGPRSMVPSRAGFGCTGVKLKTDPKPPKPRNHAARLLIPSPYY